MRGGESLGMPGQIIDGRFELRERLGHGGMGTVWRARDLALERDVALKEVRAPDAAPDAAEAEEVRDRVVREARALARINHPHVVTVHHIVAADPYPWIVMELLPGRTLEDRLRAGRTDPQEVIRYGLEILSALRAAHAAGVLHRDVKPANVLLREDGGAVLTDFGIARAAGAGATIGNGNIVGSPEYLAPERIRGAPGDEATDLWSLGMLLYALTEGRAPMRRTDALTTLAAVIEDPVPYAQHAGPLAPLLRDLLVKDPAARPDAATLERRLTELPMADFATVSTPPAALATPPPPPYRPPLDTPGTVPQGSPRRNRTPLYATLSVLAAGVLIAGLLVFTRSGGDDGGRDLGTGGEETAEQTEPTGPAEPDEERTEPSPPPAEPPGGGPAGEREESEDPADGGGTDDGSPPSPEPDPQDTDPLLNTWIAQLFSESVDSGEAVRDQRLAAIRAQVPDAEVLRSDDYSSLRPGYWVIYVPGFSDGHAAIAYCADRGMTSSQDCVGRYLSDTAADGDLICHPPGGGSQRCEE